MKKQILLGSLTALVSSWATAQVNLTINIIGQDEQSTVTRTAELVEPAARAGLVTPAFQNPIHNEDLLTSDTTPLYTIRGSGRYYLAGNITATRATTTTGTVFQIAADNVSLDMNDKILAPNSASAHTTADAIAVSTGKSNIQIMNGTIQCQDSAGTQRFAKGVVIAGATSYAVKLLNVAVTRAKSTGFEVSAATNDFSMENCSANDGAVTSAALTGATLTAVTNLSIRNCKFTNNITTTSGNCTGLVLTDCSDGVIENCVSTNNQSASGVTIGVNLAYTSSGCKNIQLKNVNASSNNSTAGGAATGIAIVDSPLVLLTDCIANNNSSAGGAAYGINVTDSSANCNACSFIRVQANNNNSSSSSAYGIRIDSDNNNFEDVMACSNYATVSAGVYGIYLNAANENRLNRCLTNYNNCTYSSNADTNANVYGIYATTSNNNHFLDCEAIGNTTSSTAAVTTAGFYSTAGASNRFEKCVANGNKAAGAADVAMIAAGFMFSGAETRSQIIKSEAVGNWTVGSGSAARCYGIYFQTSSSGASQCTVRESYIAYNTITAGKVFGFYDNRDASTTVLINNLAVGQGQCAGSALDASLQWNGNSEPSSSQNYFWKHAGTGDDPRNLIQEAPILNFLSISTSVGDWSNISIY